MHNVLINNRECQVDVVVRRCADCALFSSVLWSMINTDGSSETEMKSCNDGNIAEEVSCCGFGSLLC